MTRSSPSRIQKLQKPPLRRRQNAHVPPDEEVAAVYVRMGSSRRAAAVLGLSHVGVVNIVRRHAPHLLRPWGGQRKEI